MGGWGDGSPVDYNHKKYARQLQFIRMPGESISGDDCRAFNRDLADQPRGPPAADIHRVGAGFRKFGADPPDP